MILVELVRSRSVLLVGLILCLVVWRDVAEHVFGVVFVGWLWFVD